MATSGLWRVLTKRFRSLSKQTTGKRDDDVLRAYCDYKRSDFSAKERRLIEQRRWCVLDPGGSGWALSRGLSEDFRAQFEALAARAAAELDPKPPAGTALRDFWLNRLLSHFRKKPDTDQLFGADETGACIRNVCEASAIFCADLEQKALEAEQRMNGHRKARRPSVRRSASVASSKGRDRKTTTVDDGFDKNLRNEAWLREQKSLSQKHAGRALGVSDRSIRNLVIADKLHRTPKGRIAVDSAFFSEFHSRHSIPH